MVSKFISPWISEFLFGQGEHFREVFFTTETQTKTETQKQIQTGALLAGARALSLCVEGAKKCEVPKLFASRLQPLTSNLWLWLWANLSHHRAGATPARVAEEI